MKNLRTTTGALMVAAMLAGLTDAQAQDRGGSFFGGFSRSSRPIARVTAVADERSNSVIVSAPEEMIPMIEALIQDIENISTGTTQVRVFPLQYAYAKDMATVFTDLFREQSSSGRGGSSSVQRAVAVADERTNSVVVSAPEDIMRTIERIVKEVDTMTEDVTELRVFTLQYAKAEDTAQAINDIFEQRQSRTSSRNQPMPFGRGSFGFFGRTSTTSGQGSERRLQEETVVAVADTRTNSVIVKAASEIMVQIEAMIKQIDENPAREKKVYVYSLGNADVSDLSTILQQLFPSSSQGGGGARFGGQTNTQGLRPTTRGGTGTSGRPASGTGGRTSGGSGFGGGTSGFGSLN